MGKHKTYSNKFEQCIQNCVWFPRHVFNNVSLYSPLLFRSVCCRVNIIGNNERKNFGNRAYFYRIVFGTKRGLIYMWHSRCWSYTLIVHVFNYLMEPVLWTKEFWRTLIRWTNKRTRSILKEKVFSSFKLSESNLFNWSMYILAETFKELFL